MALISAGLLMYKKSPKTEVFLTHPGGPFWKNKDNNAWQVPKGLLHKNEEAMAAAKREFTEETGITVPENANFIDLGTVKYGPKTVYCWAFEGDLPKDFHLKSNRSPFGWPENDKGNFFDLETAKKKIFKGQLPFLERTQDVL